ncbi:hypothetical protein FB451DRAFT_1102149 [Mycena latifolia]|nr:hypothetical protein FB451DRAFT_1102149 [Mycena latifolia]
MPLQKKPKTGAVDVQQTTLLGEITRAPGLSLPRPMRMEVLICTPPNFKRKRFPEPLGMSSDVQESDVAPVPKQLKRKGVVKFGKVAESRGEAAPPPRKRKPTKLAQSDSKDDAPPPRKRKTKTVRRSSREEIFSGDEVEPEHIIPSRLRTRSKVSRRDFILLKLKRKRQGLSPPKSSESESESSDESGSTSERDSLFDGSSSDSDRSSQFIVDDDGGVVAQLPMEFSMEAHEDLSHQFKKIFQFMVHIAIRPPAEREQFMRHLLDTEEYFSVPLKVARRKISSLRGFLVASSRWEPDFIALLERYPEFELKDLVNVTPACDACRISARRGCKEGKLFGYPYNPMGFMEPKHRKPKILTLNLGRFCAERTEVFHQFTHWEFKLFSSISQEVDQLHEVAQAAGYVNDRDKFVPVKRVHDMQDADGITDWFVKRNLVDLEWAKIELMMERAQKLEGKCD